MALLKDTTIMLAAGGTGGHIFPAEALARALMKRGARIIFVTDRRGFSMQDIAEQVDVVCVRSATMHAGFREKARGIANILSGIVQSFRLIVRHKPALVVGFGGFPSFPPVIAAQLMGIPTLLHEQNAIIGRANRLLAHKAKRVALSLPHTRGLDEQAMKKSVLTGNPVRQEICLLRNKPYTPPQPDGSFQLLIVGGSQGARVFSDILPGAVSKLPEHLKHRLRIVQQCRADDLEATQIRYEHAGVRAELSAFFTDMAEKLDACHLFVGRSGATSVAELCVIGRPAIFVPYPGNRDQQQKMNADVLADVGGAWVMVQDGFTSEALSARLENFLNAPDILKNAAQAAHSIGHPEAAEKLAELVLDVLSGKPAAAPNSADPEDRGTNQTNAHDGEHENSADTENSAESEETKNREAAA